MDKLHLINYINCGGHHDSDPRGLSGGCNELPAVRRVDGVCVVYVRRKTKHDLTVRDRLTCISNALSRS